MWQASQLIKDRKHAEPQTCGPHQALRRTPLSPGGAPPCCKRYSTSLCAAYHGQKVQHIVPGAKHSPGVDTVFTPSVGWFENIALLFLVYNKCTSNYLFIQLTRTKQVALLLDHGVANALY